LFFVQGLPRTGQEENLLDFFLVDHEFLAQLTFVFLKAVLLIRGSRMRIQLLNHEILTIKNEMSSHYFIVNLTEINSGSDLFFATEREIFFFNFNV
jgi:hypothetical protein